MINDHFIKQYWTISAFPSFDFSFLLKSFTYHSVWKNLITYTLHTRHLLTPVNCKIRPNVTFNLRSPWFISITYLWYYRCNCMQVNTCQNRRSSNADSCIRFLSSTPNFRPHTSTSRVFHFFIHRKTNEASYGCKGENHNMYLLAPNSQWPFG